MEDKDTFTVLKQEAKEFGRTLFQKVNVLSIGHGAESIAYEGLWEDVPTELPGAFESYSISLPRYRIN